MRQKILTFLYQYQFLHWLIYVFYKTIGKCKFVGIGKKNSFPLLNANLYRSHFKVNGEGNSIIIMDRCLMENSSIHIKGNHNRVIVGKHSYINGLKAIIEGNNNQVLIGNDAFIMDDTRIYVVDGTTFKAGDHCMFSDRIDIRTTDNHSIIDINTGKRLNYEEDIILGNNVWIGTGVNILKGVKLADGIIVGARSVVTKRFEKENTIIAGNPGREIKHNVKWMMERV